MEWIKSDALSESSKKLYNDKINKWIGCYMAEGQNHQAYLNYIIDYPNPALNALRKEPSIKDTPTVRHVYINAIIAYLKHEKNDQEALKKWIPYSVNNSETIKARYLTGEPSELQKNKQLSWTTICKVRDELPMCSAKMLLAMYTMIPPIRGDLYDCLLLTDEKSVPSVWTTSGNHIILFPLEESKLVLVEYKTKKKLGKICIPLPKELRDLLHDFLAYCNERSSEPRVYLFEDTNGACFTRKTFSTWCGRKLKAAFGRPMTLTAIRHNYTSQLDFNKPIGELNAIANSMCHSLATQRIYKWEGGANEIIDPTSHPTPPQ